MHNAAMQACGVEGSYTLEDIDATALTAIVAALRHGDYDGCNVTIPHKQALAAACDMLDGDAKRLHVVNTIRSDDGALIGSNTDVEGFRLALEHHGQWPAAGSCAVVFGAGGVAAAVTLALSRVRLARLTIAARQQERASSLVDLMNGDAYLEAVPWSGETVRDRVADAALIVNATPVGLTDLPLDVSRLRASCTVADVRYQPRPVDLVQAAAAAGLQASDGAEMLVRQAALSFATWTNREAPLDPMRRAFSDFFES
jgi:shikimate dehydrogenase